MAEPEKPPFHEHRLFKATAAVVGLLAALWALVGAPRPWDVATHLSSNVVPLNHTEIVLDTSGSMSGPFDGTTRLDAARDAIEKYVGSADYAGLALRRTGPSCYRPGRQIVDFDDHHGDDVRRAIAGLEPEGTSNLVITVRQAIEDLGNASRGAPNGKEEVLILTAGAEDCGEEVVEKVKRALRDTPIDAVLTICALSANEKKKRRIEDTWDAVEPYAEVDVVAVNDKEGLDLHVEQASKGIPAASSPTSRGIPPHDEAGPELESGEGPESESPRARSGRESPIEEEEEAAEMDPVEEGLPAEESAEEGSPSELQSPLDREPSAEAEAPPEEPPAGAMPPEEPSAPERRKPVLGSDP